ncbi:RDD family protein [Streptomyces sp. NPDC058371]|uniref:RDD family protein n=1 Tax=Streptomyces sp. NPDC058371 TaxID=3346463 RepID=UPI003660DB91
MSAPTPAPGDDRPREGYYPDPSIPGYVRYWNGAAWVPGTSRPAPSDGVPLAPPPGGRPASVPAPSPAPAEETGPHFFDEDPGLAAEPQRVSPADAQHGSRPEPASAWGADRSRQTGFGGEQDRRVSWGAAQGADPRVPHAAEPGDAVVQPDGRSARTDGTATIPPAESDRRSPQPPASGGTVVFRRPTAGSGNARTPSAAGATAENTPGLPGTREPLAAEGNTAFRAPSPRTEQQGGAQSGGTGAAAATPAPAGPRATPAPVPQQTPAPVPQTPPTAAQQAGGPMSPGAGGGQPSWAQQVHRLAGAGDEGQPVAPWKPPVDDVFQAAARAQAAVRPAALGKRLAARLVDTVVLAGATAVAAVPLGTRAIDHINEKIDAAKLSGETVTVWLLDGTTTAYAGVILAVLLVFGVLYEALPTAKWGRTLGKRLCGIQVRDIEGAEPPTFGRALRRWLVYSIPGVLAIGVIGVLWCLFDRPWRQCWHDKAAHTFVAA